ncbi:MAG: hypothetical protein PHP50_03295 [Lachnospiraceae bacterium]|nr:hypothetical protein [Lachnospiraceae bacterium]
MKSKYLMIMTIAICFLGLSIICQVIEAILFRQMIRETENMSTTDNKQLKQCKL